MKIKKALESLDLCKQIITALTGSCTYRQLAHVNSNPTDTDGLDFIYWSSDGKKFIDIKNIHNSSIGCYIETMRSYGNGKYVKSWWYKPSDWIIWKCLDESSEDEIICYVLRDKKNIDISKFKSYSFDSKDTLGKPYKGHGVIIQKSFLERVVISST